MCPVRVVVSAAVSGRVSVRAYQNIVIARSVYRPVVRSRKQWFKVEASSGLVAAGSKCVTRPARGLGALRLAQPCAEAVAGQTLRLFSSGCHGVRWMVALIVIVVSWSHLIINRRHLL